MVVGFTTTYAIVPNTTKVVSSNPVHGEVKSIQLYLKKKCQWLATGLWFSPGTLFPPTSKTDRHDITDILLKVALNIINKINKALCNSTWKDRILKDISHPCFCDDGINKAEKFKSDTFKLANVRISEYILLFHWGTFSLLET